MHIAVTRKIPEAGLRLLQDADQVDVWQDGLPPSRDELVRFAQGADGILTLLTERVDGELLDQLPTVRVVSNFAVGFDNIDVEACTQRGVAVCITPDVLTDTTADCAFALLMAVARQLSPAARAVQAGQWKTWEPLGFLGQDVHHATIGIIGMGRIGKAMARRAHGFGMRILYADEVAQAEIEQDTGARRCGLDELLRESDFVSVHVPLTPATDGMIGPAELTQMKSTAILINTARGPVVQTDALLDALRTGEIWGAGLDVTEPEPLPADHPLLDLPNVLITPHIASASEATRGAMSELAAQNVLAVLREETPPRCLNPEVLNRGPR